MQVISAMESKNFYEGLFDSDFKFQGITVTKERCVESYEIEIFTGYGGTAFINGESKNIRPGLCICARPGDIRYSKLPIRCHYVKIMPKMQNIASFFEKIPRFFRIKSTEKCKTLINDMLNAKINGNELLRIARLLELISILSEESMLYEKLHNIQQTSGRDQVESAIIYMEEHFREKCLLKDIAREANFSPIYFHKVFKNAIGETPYDYLGLLRINEAKKLLITENMGMAEIAERAGFSSQAYFNYVFKKAVGLTPTAYRKKHIEKYSF